MRLGKIGKFMASNRKNVSDIVNNYQQLAPCERVKNIFKQAYLAATDYNNGEHYSQLTDLTSFAAAKKIHARMARNETGLQILNEKPRITDEIYYSLGNLTENAFGKQYFNFMSKLNFKPSERPIVRYIPDLEYAYVLQRYKEIHDFLHVLLAKHISVDEELALKWFQMRQLGLPSASLASLISPLLSSKFDLDQICKIIRIADRSQFIMNIYYEHHFEENIDEVRSKFGFL